MLSKAAWPRRSISMSDDITHRASVTGSIEMLNRRSHRDRADAAHRHRASALAQHDTVLVTGYSVARQPLFVILVRGSNCGRCATTGRTPDTGRLLRIFRG